MIDATVVAYATRHLGRLAVAALLAAPLVIHSGGISARTPASPAADAGRNPPSPRSALQGPARILDGDTIEIGEIRVRLEGIDAPEAGQQCRTRSGEAWPCGARATATLARLIGTDPVTCENHGQDRYGRMLGICWAGDVEVNAEMVRRGMAWAFVRYSQVYVAAEAEARVRRLGIWDGEAIPAWEYRASRWQQAEPQAPSGCAIKGNVTAKGRIYHMPWSPWYEQINMEGGRGKRWFCNEAEAISAGWRPAHIQ